MRIFHQLVYDGLITTSGLYISDASLSERAGSVERIHVSGYAAQVVGTTPALTITMQGSADGATWGPYSGTNPVDNLSLSTSGETLFQGIDTSLGKPRLARLVLTLTGANAQAYLRVWITGRDRTRRSKEIMSALTDISALPNNQGGA